ncbi:AMP-binding protein [Asanoa sp. WMMD1127]|uniref:AMP-binding protein n=1 Tax=Asanoa sp. WMMD1127 TaxID=3016107 RepID=UPI0024166C87|nr:AMP-binding protein [Asanoa sp. WMMD1127]MDG4826516.1 AMP-binding protein [Asanoa sp. WMMD1127]
MPALTGTGAAGTDRPDAVRFGDEAVSFADLAGRAGAVARRVAGARAAAVLATSTVDTVAAVLGGLAAGVPIVPVPPDAGPGERDHILRDSGADLLLNADAAPPGIEAVPAPRDSAPWPDPEATDRTALVLYTSGTTGKPKGVPITGTAIAACLDGLADAWDWTPDDRLVHALPLYHVHGLVLGVLGPLRTGSRLHHTGRPRPDLLAAAGGSLYFAVPTIWHRVVADPDAARALRGARLLVSGSAALPAGVFAKLRELTGQAPVERYGMTETLITVATRADGRRAPGAVGIPVKGVETRLVDEAGHPIAHDGTTPGALEIRGSTVFAGYLDRPDANRAAFTADGWFRTGDVATIDGEGVHRIVGRASTDLIKTGGYRVGAGEIEDALLTHPAVREAAVVGRPDDDLGQRVVAYVVADAVAPDVLVQHVAATLSAHKRPREVVFVDALPRNALGKVQKHRL